MKVILVSGTEPVAIGEHIRHPQGDQSGVMLRSPEISIARSFSVPSTIGSLQFFPSSINSAHLSINNYHVQPRTDAKLMQTKNDWQCLNRKAAVRGCALGGHA